MPDRRRGLGGPAAGALAGLAGLVVFLVLHAWWITPIWMIAPVGAALAAGGGAAVGTAYDQLADRLPGGLLRVPAVAIGCAAVLAPAVILAELWGPTIRMDGDGGATLLVSPVEAALDITVGLFGSSGLAGAILGGLVGRTRRAAATTALAGAALAIGPGHNIPFLATTPALWAELALLGAVTIAGSFVLVVAEGWTPMTLSRRARAGG